MTTKYKVLLLDDEKLLLDLYSIKFLKAGYGVIICTSVDQALTTLRNGYAPDAILFDINMPEKSGFEFLEKLADIHLPKNCLKIALTNEGQDAELIRTKELGANAHLIKASYTPGEIVDVITLLLQKR